MRTSISFLVVAIASLWVTPAVANPGPEGVAKAKAAMKEANELATAGKLKKAVPKYREALKADPGGHPLAYYNLAEVYRHLKRCDQAAFMFQLYASMHTTEQAKKDAAKGLKRCKVADYPTLKVEVAPEEAQVKINGFLASNGNFGPAQLPPGKYDIEVVAVDHKQAGKKVTLEEGEVEAVEFELEELTFYGKIRVEANVDGATVRVFEGPSYDTKEVHQEETPMKKGVEVEAGRHFVEVTADGYDRWIRNVTVDRNDVTVVKVNMTRSKPKEIQ